MKNYHLSPDGDAWKLTSEDGTVTVQNFDTKEEAVASCAAFMQERTGSLKIHRADGSFEEERTYPRAADPVETKG